ncbi:hypothetical protein M422DRAFT_780381 [Sphaerobolus stellatus SS14]|uniref:DUF726-domain-containing protein n=1 Tax=Sphaerobolus stellatus (strain SS14) TaxID=990650 RepID=A0A0C9VIB6_SPHS4|nr:hypothetical protein M422DRAFT_780381 [Sphaerobolus stellatus SS14]
MADITKIALSESELSDVDQLLVFEYFIRRLVDHRNLAIGYAKHEYRYSNNSIRTNEFILEICGWADELLKHAWAACGKHASKCPPLEAIIDASIDHLPRLPPVAQTSKLLNTIIFLHLTSTKSYSAHTRSFLLRSFGTFDEWAVAETLKHPDEATKAADGAKERHAQRSKIWRRVGIGAGAVAGGVLIGVTGGLAAPLVGAGLSSVLGILGIGGPIGLIATGLASSGAVCGALFGAYGAKSTAEMVARHTREIRDMEFVPVRPMTNSLAVRICISGWLESPTDIVGPWMVYNSDQDTFALQWEVEALQTLSTALYDLIRLNAMNYIKWSVLKHTVLSTLMAGLSPLFLLKIGQIVDNPWSNAKALAVKAGKVLGTLLAERALGNRPVTLTGYSLGSLVIVEALKYLAELPPAKTAHIVQDVFLFGTPAPTSQSMWAAMRRVVAGRIVNCYAESDYVLAILSRTTDGEWGVAGLQPVDVPGVENVQCLEVQGHLQWRGRVGQYLQLCGADGVQPEEVELQLREVAEPFAKEMEKELELMDLARAEEEVHNESKP